MLRTTIFLLVSSTIITASTPPASAFKTPPASPARAVQQLELRTPSANTKATAPVVVLVVAGRSAIGIDENILKSDIAEIKSACKSPRSPFGTPSKSPHTGTLRRRSESEFPRKSTTPTRTPVPYMELQDSGAASVTPRMPSHPTTPLSPILAACIASAKTNVKDEIEGKTTFPGQE